MAETIDQIKSLDYVLAEHIFKTIWHHFGNAAKTAKTLKISKGTLRAKMESYGITADHRTGDVSWDEESMLKKEGK